MALVLRRVDYSETSQVVTLFTHARGKVSAIAKGARRAKSRFFGPLDSATLHEVVVYPRGEGLSILAESHLVERFAGLREHIETIQLAQLVLELLMVLTQENDPEPGLFQLARNVLHEARDPRRAQLEGLAFMLGALAETGFAPVVERCVVCSRGSPTGKRLAFDCRGGGVLCADCAADSPGAIAISGAAAALMRRVAQASRAALGRIRAGRGDVGEALEALGAHVRHFSGRELRTLGVLVKG